MLLCAVTYGGLMQSNVQKKDALKHLIYGHILYIVKIYINFGRCRVRLAGKYKALGNFAIG